MSDLKSRIRQTVIDFYSQQREDWLRRAKEKAREIVTEKGEVCADDIHEAIPFPPEIRDGRVMGSVFVGMRRVRYQKSRRAICHNRTISVFTT